MAVHCQLDIQWRDLMCVMYTDVMLCLTHVWKKPYMRRCYVVYDSCQAEALCMRGRYFELTYVRQKPYVCVDAWRGTKGVLYVTIWV